VLLKPGIALLKPEIALPTAKFMLRRPEKEGFNRGNVLFLEGNAGIDAGNW
jgi:hypothetical protein